MQARKTSVSSGALGHFKLRRLDQQHQTPQQAVPRFQTPHPSPSGHPSPVARQAREPLPRPPQHPPAHDGDAATRRCGDGASCGGAISRPNGRESTGRGRLQRRQSRWPWLFLGKFGSSFASGPRLQAVAEQSRRQTRCEAGDVMRDGSPDGRQHCPIRARGALPQAPGPWARGGSSASAGPALGAHGSSVEPHAAG